MEPRSIFVSCPEHGPGCVAILHFEENVRSIKTPGWADRWRQRYPGLGVAAIEHVQATVTQEPTDPEPEVPSLAGTMIEVPVPKKRWFRRDPS